MSLVCLIIAIVLFVVAALGQSAIGGVLLVPLGLALVALALAVGALPPISIRR